MHPLLEDAAVLALREMLALGAAREQVLPGRELRARYPGGNRFTRGLGDFKLNWPLRLALHHDRPGGNRGTLVDVPHAQRH